MTQVALIQATGWWYSFSGEGGRFIFLTFCPLLSTRVSFSFILTLGLQPTGFQTVRGLLLASALGSPTLLFSELPTIIKAEMQHLQGVASHLQGICEIQCQPASQDTCIHFLWGSAPSLTQWRSDAFKLLEGIFPTFNFIFQFSVRRVIQVLLNDTSGNRIPKACSAEVDHFLLVLSPEFQYHCLVL